MCSESEQSALFKDWENLMGQKALKGTSPCPESLWQLSSRCLEHGPCRRAARELFPLPVCGTGDTNPAVPPGMMPFRQVGLMSSAGP